MKQEPITEQNKNFLTDESRLTGQAEQILFPETEEEALAALRAGAEKGERVTLQGSRTGLMGGAVPNGGTVLNLSLLDRAGRVERTDHGGRLTVQCGVPLEEIHKLAAASGLRFPPDPTEETATVGGMFATAGNGPCGLRFGPSSHWVTGLSWATPEGELWQLERGACVAEQGVLPLPDGSFLELSGLEAGTDLIDFLSGSEGYYGAALSLELKLIPGAADLWGILFFFMKNRQIYEFGKQLSEWARKTTVQINAAEFYGRSTLELLDSHRENKLLSALPPFPEGACEAVYVELEGENEEQSADGLMELLDLFGACGGGEDDTWAENGAGAEKLRRLRHAVPSVLSELPEAVDPGCGHRWEVNCGGGPEDFPEQLARYEQIFGTYGVKTAVYGHLLENRLHAALLPASPEQAALCREIVREQMKLALDGGGCPASEYGTGRLRRALLSELLPPERKAELTGLRQVFDPKLRMNP